MRKCSCPSNVVSNYLGRISGPLLDRIDIHIEVPRLRQDELTAPPTGETSTAIRGRVEKARAIQRKRFAGATGVHSNARMSARQLQTHCAITPDARALLGAAIEQMNLSARAYDRILKVSRTIADLAGEETIGIPHVAEAIQYRALDRKFWAG